VVEDYNLRDISLNDWIFARLVDLPTVSCGCEVLFLPLKENHDGTMWIDSSGSGWELLACEHAMSEFSWRHDLHITCSCYVGPADCKEHKHSME
jgi:hypothetical protein